MFTQHITNKLTELRVTWKRTGDHYLLCQCLNPTHSDSTPSMSVNTDTGYTKCFTCGFVLHKDYWVDGVLDEDTLEELNRISKYKMLKDSLKKQEIGLQECGLPINDEEVPEGYRGLSKETFSNFGMFTCNTGKYANRVIFPFFEKDKIVGFTSRANFVCNTKYLHSRGFNNSETLYPLNILKKAKSNFVVLTEGIVDTINLWELGAPSICNFGVAYHFSSTKISKLLSCGIEKIYVMFDNDVAGIKATKDFMEHKELLEYFEVLSAEKLPELKEFYQSGCKDFNEFYMRNKEAK